MLEEEQDLQRWRVHWAAAVALLRAVGHVLNKVDGADNPGVREAAAAAFERWKSTDPAHEIFRDFIDRERNNLLKEYRSNVHPLNSVKFLLQYTAVPEGGGEPIQFAEVAAIGENIYRPLIDGPWEGNDARDVLEMAIDWWERELAAIDDLTT
jgi:hypothetical protein